MLGGIVELKARINISKAQEDLKKLEKIFKDSPDLVIKPVIDFGLEDLQNEMPDLPEISLEKSQQKIEIPPPIEPPQTDIPKTDLSQLQLPNLKSIKKSLETIVISLDNLNKLPPIIIKVDDTALTALNAHLDLKDQHYHAVKNSIEKNPLRPNAGALEEPTKRQMIPPVSVPQIAPESKPIKEPDFNTYLRKLDVYLDDLEQIVSKEKKTSKTNEKSTKINETNIKTLDKGSSLFSQSINLFSKGIIDFGITEVRNILNIFKSAVMLFQKSVRKGFLKSLFSNFQQLLGQAVGQILVTKMSKGLGLLGTNLIEALLPHKELEKVLQTTLMVTYPLEKLFKVPAEATIEKVKSEGDNVSMLDKFQLQALNGIYTGLRKANSHLVKSVAHLKKTNAIIDLLKVIGKIIKLGIQRGLPALIGNAVSKILLIPLTLLTSTVAAAGHATAQLRAVPLKRMFDRVMSGERSPENIDKAQLWGFVVGTFHKEFNKFIKNLTLGNLGKVINGLRTVFGKIFSLFTRFKDKLQVWFKPLGDAIQNIVNRIKQSKLGQAISQFVNNLIKGAKRMFDNTKTFLGKAGNIPLNLGKLTGTLFKDSLGMTKRPEEELSFFEKIKNFRPQLNVEGLKGIAEDLLGQTFEEYQEDMANDPTTVEDLLKAILKEVKVIKADVSSIKIPEKSESSPIEINEIGAPIPKVTNELFSQPTIEPFTKSVFRSDIIPPKEGKSKDRPLKDIAKDLAAMAQNLRKQGGRLIPDPKTGKKRREKPKEGGIALLASEMPDLGLDLSLNVQDLKKQLENTIVGLGEGGEQQKIEDIGSLFFKQWEALAHEQHKFYPQSVDFVEPAPIFSPEMSSSGSGDIGEESKQMLTSLSKDLVLLSQLTEAIAYKIKHNLSEGSPGLTSHIRERWTFTTKHIKERILSLVSASKTSAKEIQSALSEASPGLTSHIRDKWDYTVKHISESLTSGKISGALEDEVSNIDNTSSTTINNISKTEKNEVKRTKDNTKNTKVKIPDFLKGFELPNFDFKTQFEDLKNLDIVTPIKIGLNSFILTLTKQFKDLKKLDFYTPVKSSLNHFIFALINTFKNLKKLEFKTPIKVGLNDFVTNLTSQIESVKNIDIFNSIAESLVNFKLSITENIETLKQSNFSLAIQDLTAVIFDKITLTTQSFLKIPLVTFVVNKLNLIWQNIKVLFLRTKQGLSAIKTTVINSLIKIKKALLDIPESLLKQLEGVKNEIKIKEEGSVAVNELSQNLANQIKEIVFNKEPLQNSFEFLTKNVSDILDSIEIPTIEFDLKLFNIKSLNDIKQAFIMIQNNLNAFSQDLEELVKISNLSKSLVKLENFFLSRIKRFFSTIKKLFNSFLVKIGKQLNLSLSMDMSISKKITRIVTKAIIGFVTGAVKGIGSGAVKVVRDIKNPISKEEREIEKTTEYGEDTNDLEVFTKQLIEDSFVMLEKVLKEVGITLWEESKVVLESFQKIFSTIQDTLQPTISTIENAINKFKETLEQLFRNLVKPFDIAIPALKSVFDQFVALFQKMYRFLFTTWQKLEQSTKGILTMLNPFGKNKLSKGEKPDFKSISDEVEMEFLEESKTVTDTSSEQIYNSLLKILTTISTKDLRGLIFSLNKTFDPRKGQQGNIDVLIEDIAVNPKLLTELTDKISNQWEDLELDIKLGSNPLEEFAENLTDIESKWDKTGSHFTKVTQNMAKDSKTQSNQIKSNLSEASPGLTSHIRKKWTFTTNHIDKRIKDVSQKSKKHSKVIRTSLSEASPGLTSHVRDKWDLTTRHMGKRMATTSKDSKRTFYGISQALLGLKVTGIESANKLSDSFKTRLSELGKDLTQKGEIKLFELINFDLEDTQKMSAHINNLRDDLASLTSISGASIQEMVLDDQDALLPAELLQVRKAKRQIRSASEQKDDLEQTLRKQPDFRDKQGNIDKVKTLKYLKEVQTKLTKYNATVGTITQNFKVNPKFQKILDKLPAESRMKYQVLFKNINKDLKQAERFADKFQDKLVDVLNLDTQSLLDLGLPENIVKNIEGIVTKGKEEETRQAYADFELPEGKDVKQMATRTLVNIDKMRSRLNKRETQALQIETKKQNIITNTAVLRKKAFLEYQRLVKSGHLAEAKILKRNVADHVNNSKRKLSTLHDLSKKMIGDLAQASVQMGMFDDMEDVKVYLRQFKTVEDKQKALMDKLKNTNESYTESVIKSNNRINQNLAKYKLIGEDLARLEGKRNKLIEKRSQLEKQFKTATKQALETNNTRKLLQLEKQRKIQIDNITKSERLLLTEIQQQTKTREATKRDVFDDMQLNEIGDINELYETEAPDDKKITMFDRIKQALIGIKDLGKGLFSGILKQYAQLKERFPILEKIENKFKKISLQVGVFAVAGITLLTNFSKILTHLIQSAFMFLTQLSKEAFNKAKDAEALQKKFSFVIGAKEGVKQLKQVKKQVDDLGMSVSKMKHEYLMFSQGLKTLRMDDRAMKMFEQAQKGMVVRGMDEDAASTVFSVLNEIANTGEVTVEFIAKQLPEAMPGSLNVMADAMGVTADQMLILAKRGKLLGEEILPRFLSTLARQADSGLDDALNSGNVKMAQLMNNLSSLQRVMGQTSLDLSKPLITGLNKVLKFVTTNLEEIKSVLAGVVVGFFYPLILEGIKVIGGFLTTAYLNILIAIEEIQYKARSGISRLTLDTNILMNNIRYKLEMLKVTVLKVFGFIKTALMTIAPMLLTTFAIEGIKTFFDYFNNEFEKMSRKLEKKIKEIKLSEQKAKTKDTIDTDKDTQEMIAKRGGNWFTKTVDTVITRPFNVARQAFSTPTTKGLEMVGREDLSNRIQQEISESTIAANMYNKAIISASKNYRSALKMIEITDKKLVESGGYEEYIKKRVELDKEFTVNASLIEGMKAVTTEENLKEIDALRERNNVIMDELETLEETNFAHGNYSDRIEELNTLLAELDKEIELGDPKGLLKSLRQNVESTINVLTGQIDNMKNKINDAKNAFINLNKELSKVDAVIEAVKFQNEITYNQEKTDILRKQVIDKTVATPQIQAGLAKADVNNLQRQYQTLQQSLKDRTATIEQTKDVTTVNVLLGTLRSYDKNIKTLNDVTLEVINRAEGNQNIRDGAKDLLSQLKQQYEIQKEISSIEQNLMQTQASFIDQQIQAKNNLKGFVRSLEDLDISILDYYKQRQRQLEDFETQFFTALKDNQRGVRNLLAQYDDLKAQLLKDLTQYKNELTRAKKKLKASSDINQLRQKLNLGAEGMFSGILDLIENASTSNLSFNEQIDSANQERLQIETDTVSLSRQVRDMSEAIADHEVQRLQTLMNLVRTQDDFVTNQANSWRGIERQVDDMETQAKSMGFEFHSIAQLMTDARKEFERVVSELANFNPMLGGGASTGDFKMPEGYTVKGGTIIGQSGNTGVSSGAHLHITVKENGKAIEPPDQLKQIIQLGEKTLSQLSVYSGFGVQRGNRTHKGEDFSANVGTPIKLLEQVKNLQYKTGVSGYGNLITFDWNGLTVELGHLSDTTGKIIEQLKSNNQVTLSTSGNYKEIAVQLIKELEGFRTKAYYDTDMWRIGYGTGFKGNQNRAYNENSTITQQEADKQLLQYDLPRFEERIVEQLGTHWNKLNSNVKASLLSVAYNKGSLTNSMVEAIKKGNMGLLKQIISNTDKGTHKTRRQKEASLIGTPIVPSSSIANTPIRSLRKDSPMYQNPYKESKPVKTKAIDSGASLEPIDFTSSQDVKDLVRMLANDKKLTQQQLEEVLQFTAIGNTKDAMNTLKGYVKDLETYKTKLVDLKVEQAKQDYLKEQIAQTRALNQKTRELSEAFKSQRETFLNNRIQMLKNKAEMKGYVSYQDEITIKLIETKKAQLDFVKTLREQNKALRDLNDIGSLTKADLQNQIDMQLQAGMVTKEYHQQLQQFIDTSMTVSDAYTKMIAENEKMIKTTEDSIDKTMEYVTALSILETQIKQLSEFSNVLSSVIDLADIVGDKNLSDSLKIQNIELQAMQKYLESLKSIDQLIEQAKEYPDLFPPGRLQQLETLKLQLKGLSETSIKVQIEQQQYESTLGKLNDFKDVFSKIGEIQNSISFGSGDANVYLSKILEIQTKYMELDKQLETMGKSANSAFSREVIESYRASLTELQTKELEQMKYEMSDLYKYVKEPLSNAMKNIVSGFIDGTMDIQGAVVTLLDSIADKLMDFGMDMLTDEILKGLLGIFGSGDYGGMTIEQGLAVGETLKQETITNSGMYSQQQLMKLDGTQFNDRTDAIFTDGLDRFEAIINNSLQRMNNQNQGSVIQTGKGTETQVGTSDSQFSIDTDNTLNLFESSFSNTLSSVLSTFTGDFGGIIGNLFSGFSSLLSGGTTGGFGGFLETGLSAVTSIFGFKDGGIINTIDNFKDGGIINTIDNFKDGGLVHTIDSLSLIHI